MNSSEWVGAISYGGFGCFLSLIPMLLGGISPPVAIWSAFTGFLVVLLVLFLIHWTLKWNEKKPKDFFEKLCPHWSIRWVGDAWDSEFICRWCGKRWFNKQPEEVRWSFAFQWNEKWYVIRNGKAAEIKTR